MRILLICLFASHAAFARADGAEIVMTVDGFDVSVKEAHLGGSRDAYRLLDPIREITRARGELKRMGVDPVPRVVEQWRDEKFAEVKKRAAGLRAVMAHPERARSVYETTVSSTVDYQKWLTWTANYRTEEKIAEWEKRPNVGRYRYDLEKGTGPALWQLLTAMVEERYAKGEKRRAYAADYLDPADLDLLREISRATFEDDPNLPALSPAEKLNVSSAALAFMDALRSGVFIASLEKSAKQIAEREEMTNAVLIINDPQLEKVREYVNKLNPMELTRARLTAPMTVSEAVSALHDYDGRQALAIVKLAKNRKEAVPALVASLSDETPRGHGVALMLLNWLDAKEALAPIRELKLYASHDEYTYNGALSYLAKRSPEELEGVVGAMVVEFEKQPTYSGISDSFVPPAIPRAMYFFAKARPGAAARSLRAYLSSPKPGAALAAAAALARIGDPAGVPYALKYLSRAGSEYDRHRALETVKLIGGKKNAEALDAIAGKIDAPELAVTARDLEYAETLPERRWRYVEKYLDNESKPVAYWAFNKVEDGFRAQDPGIIPLLEKVSATEGALYQRRAKELLAYSARLTRVPGK